MQLECRIERAERCIKQSVLIVVKNVKFHSNPILADRFTAEIVGRREDSREDVDIKFCYRLNLAVEISASIFDLSFLIPQFFSYLFHP